MGQTPNLALPYPELTDPPDGPAQIKALALRVDAYGIQAQTGQVTINTTGGTTGSATVTFSPAFPATPTCFANLTTGAGYSSGWFAKAMTPSATAVIIGLNGSTAQTQPFTVQWGALRVAAPMPQRDAPNTTDLDGLHAVTATCHTPGCPAENQPAEGVLVPDVPEDWRWTGIICGGCGQPITDIT